MKNVGRFFFNLTVLALYAGVSLQWLIVVTVLATNQAHNPILGAVLLTCEVFPLAALFVMFGVSVLHNIEFE